MTPIITWGYHNLIKALSGAVYHLMLNDVNILFLCIFPLLVDVFTSVSVCNPDLFSLNRFMTFKQLYYCCLYLEFNLDSFKILPPFLFKRTN